MNVSRAIIDDLYPLYEAGEASAESRALIEQYLAEHPAEAATLRAAIELPLVEPPPDLEARSLKRTIWLLREGSTIGAAALALSYAPTAISYIERGKPHILYQDLPGISALAYLAAIALWAGFFFVCWRIRAAGLLPRRTWPARMVWVLIGTTIGLAACAPIQSWTGWTRAVNILPCVAFTVAILMGEWLGQIPKVNELTRPITIFGPQDDDGRD